MSGPRGKTQICVLQNQGATSYLNSLLQTLPHFLQNFVVSMYFVCFVVLHVKNGYECIQLILLREEFGHTGEIL